MSFSNTGFQIFPQIFPQLFTPEEIAPLREATEALCRNAHPNDPLWEKGVPLSALSPHRNPGVEPESVSNVPFILVELPALSEVFRSFLSRPQLWAMAEECLGTKEIVYHFANITRKPAHIGPNLSWHRDYPNRYLCLKDSSHFFRALIPLEAMDHENGCTIAIPGTHCVSDEIALAEDRDKKTAENALSKKSEAVLLEAQPGDVVALHSKTIHGGGENRSPRERNLMVIQFGRSGLKPADTLYWNEERFTGWQRNEIELGESPRG